MQTPLPIVRLAPACAVVLFSLLLCQDARAKPGETQGQEQKQEGPSDPGKTQDPQIGSIALAVGDRAPELDIAGWAKGPAITLGDGQVTIVVLWSTWSDQSVSALGYLTDLHDRTGAEVRVLGVATFEPGQMGTLDPFVRGRGREIGFPVALDNKTSTYDAYCVASGSPGIPTAFVVDRRGRIAWIGHPFDGLDDVLEQVRAGSWDIEAARAQFLRRARVKERTMPMLESVTQALEQGEVERALDLYDQIIAIEPTINGTYAFQKFILLGYELARPADAVAYARTAFEGWLADDPEMCSSIAWALLEEPAFADQESARELALSLARRADTLRESRDASTLDTLARALWANDQHAEAIKAAERAVQLALDNRMKADFAARLENYKDQADAPPPAQNEPLPTPPNTD